MAKTTIDLPAALHTKLRIKAVVENRSMNAIVLEALQASLESFHLERDVLEIETISRDGKQVRSKEDQHVGRTHRPHER